MSIQLFLYCLSDLFFRLVRASFSLLAAFLALVFCGVLILGAFAFVLARFAHYM